MQSNIISRVIKYETNNLIITNRFIRDSKFGILKFQSLKGEILEVKYPKSFTIYINKKLKIIVISATINSRKELNTLVKLVWNVFEDLASKFSIEMLLQGSGLRLLKVENSLLTFDLAYSHLHKIPVPDGLSVDILNNDGTKFKVQGSNRVSVINYCENLRKLRPPKAFTGMGLRFANEFFKIKERKKDD